jgi:ribosomal protein L11 methylase PrmA
VEPWREAKLRERDDGSHGNSPELLADDLRNLRMLNRYLSGSRSVLLGLQRALGREPLKQISVLDVGTGSADIPAAIFAWAKRRNVAAKIAGVEADSITARIAANQTKQLTDIKKNIVEISAENTTIDL